MDRPGTVHRVARIQVGAKGSQGIGWLPAGRQGLRNRRRTLKSRVAIVDDKRLPRLNASLLAGFDQSYVDAGYQFSG